MIGTRSPKSLLLLGLTVTLGATAGVLLAGRPAHACDCSSPSWELRLRSVTSTDSATSHEAFWPETARLLAYEGTAIITSEEQSDTIVAYVSADAKERASR